jgi:membrane fusion protein (multidrug efflux system)
MAVLFWPGVLAFAALLYYGLDRFNDALTHESTDDAFVEGHVVPVAPKIAGHVAKVLVSDNQLVKMGDPLVEIDSRDYELQLAKRRAVTETNQANLTAVSKMLELMAAKMTTAEGGAKQAHAMEDSSRATTANAQAIFQLDQGPAKIGALSRQDYGNAEAAAKSATANLHAAEENSAQADSRVIEAKSQFAAAQAGVDLAKAQIKEADIGVNGAELDLSYTKIFAPCDGRVTRKSVEPGSYVQIGQALLAIVPPEVWLVGNFKETQLERVRPGQPVEITVDSLGRKLRGRVDSVQAGSGARFSLLPPENAVGNFVKVVQRVPVKILFDEPLPQDQIVGPGLSVYPSVRVKDEFMPQWVLVIAAAFIALCAALIIKLTRKSSAE